MLLSFSAPALRAAPRARAAAVPPVRAAALPATALPRRAMSAAAEAPTYQHILVEKKEGNVALVTLNRPQALNALCDALGAELTSALRGLDEDPSVGAIVLTGSRKAFAAGADIKEMSTKTYMDAYSSNMLTQWDLVARLRKPIIAAVSGFALGGGCELAMMCDILLASESARFGQPEIKLGTIPGIGGTQRLTRAIGKSRAMEMVLTGDLIDAATAERYGLVSRVIPDDQLIPEALKVAGKIAAFSKPIVSMAKECVNQALETSLAEGVHFERRVFHSTFATADQKEGMRAFAAKATPTWSDK